ncbi:MAG TPA: CPBP family glutamic-type intramembrane protease [Spirochaetales bacterium]|nr:CPBP family glutamic-type intramembrane protease [Spirochaetales bacterium]
MYQNKRWALATAAAASACVLLMLPLWGFLFPAGQNPSTAASLVHGASLAWMQFLALLVIIGMLGLSPECGMRRPKLADGTWALSVFGLFLASGLLASLGSSLTGGSSGRAALALSVRTEPRLWPVALLFSIGVAYREEFLYRACLTAIARRLHAPAWMSIAAPAALFAIGHLWQGPWAVAQAALAGLGAGILYNRGFASVHALAWGHAAYNLVVLLRS